MNTRRAVLLALLAVEFGHWAWRTHVPVPETVDQLSGMRLWSGVAILAGVALAVAGRTGWLLSGSERAVGALPLTPRPPRLQQALAECGPVPYEVSCVASTERTAFAAGARRPRIYVTTGLVRQLDVQALAAVIVHEVEHARRHDPARRALRRACADLLWPLPITRWWVWVTSLHSELAADRVAVVRCGEAALARALVASAPAPAGLGHPEPAGLGPDTEPAGPARTGPGVAFHTSAGRRAAQLLGEELPPARPRWPVLLATLGWLLLTLAAFSCVTDLAAAYLVFPAQG